MCLSFPFPFLLLLLHFLFLRYPRAESFLLSLLCLLVRVPVARLVGINMGDCLFAIDILAQLIIGLRKWLDAVDCDK